jgi:hypothetical protein
MTIWQALGGALKLIVDNVVLNYERRLAEKEKEMAKMREMIAKLQERVRKIDDVEQAFREMATRYNELVKENADNEKALQELTEAFEKELDETLAAVVENTDSEPEDPEDAFEPSGNVAVDPTSSGRGGGKSGSKKAGK